MNRLLITILILLVTSCSKKEPLFVDKAFEDVLNEVTFQFKSSGLKDFKNSSTIKFGDTYRVSKAASAVCYTISNKRNKIVVNQETWERLSFNEQVYLIAHEIGHCEFNCKHDRNFVEVEGVDGQAPASIMFPSSSRAARWSQYLGDNYYFKQLTNCKKK